MLGFECDCSVDCDDTLKAWEEEWLVAGSRPPVWCCECGRWIRPGESYWLGSGIMRDDIEDYDYFGTYDTLSERDEMNREEFPTCLGCRRIAERFCFGGYCLGMLSEAVAECLGFDYYEDPSEWDDDEVEEEDEDNRRYVLELRGRQKSA